MWIFAPRQFEPPAGCMTPGCASVFYAAPDAWAVPMLEDAHGCVLWYGFVCADCAEQLSPSWRAQRCDGRWVPSRQWDRLWHGQCGLRAAARDASAELHRRTAS